MSLWEDKPPRIFTRIYVVLWCFFALALSLGIIHAIKSPEYSTTFHVFFTLWLISIPLIPIIYIPIAHRIGIQKAEKDWEELEEWSRQQDREDAEKLKKDGVKQSFP